MPTYLGRVTTQCHVAGNGETKTTTLPLLPEQRGQFSIFVLEDERASREILGEVLSTYGYNVFTAANAAEYFALFDRNPLPEVCLIDLNLGKSPQEGMDVIRETERRKLITNFLIMSGQDENWFLSNIIKKQTDTDISFLRNDADKKPAYTESYNILGYLKKPFVCNEFVIFTIDMACKMIELANGYSLDKLTRVPNRRMFDDNLLNAIRTWTKHLRKWKTNPNYAPDVIWDLSVAILDIDWFKKFNDIYGHRMGDEVLAEMAAFMSSHLSSSDIFARYGGEEFCIIMPETKLSAAVKTINRVTNEFSAKSRELVKGTKELVTLSSGVATLSFADYERLEYLRNLGFEKPLQNMGGMRSIEDEQAALELARKYLCAGADKMMYFAKKKKDGKTSHCADGNGFYFIHPKDL